MNTNMMRLHSLPDSFAISNNHWFFACILSRSKPWNKRVFSRLNSREFDSRPDFQCSEKWLLADAWSKPVSVAKRKVTAPDGN